jgi:hypothetical protein
MLNKYLYLAFVCLILSGSCKKPEPDKPKAASEIAFTVNDTEWKGSFNELMYISRFGDYGPCAGFYEDGYSMTIFGVQARGTDTTVIWITFEKKPGIVGDYTIKYTGDPEAVALFYPNMADYYYEKNEMYQGSTGTGKLSIRSYDSTKGILEGEFAFELKPNAANQGKPSYSIKTGKLVNLKRYED